MATGITATQQVTYTIAPKDSKGRPAELDGVPVWAVSDETVLAIEPAADGLSAVVKAQAPGSARVSVTGDADMGAGIEPIIGTDDITVRPGKAVVLELVAGAPEEQT